MCSSLRWSSLTGWTVQHNILSMFYSFFYLIIYIRFNCAFLTVFLEILNKTSPQTIVWTASQSLIIMQEEQLPWNTNCVQSEVQMPPFALYSLFAKSVFLTLALIVDMYAVYIKKFRGCLLFLGVQDDILKCFQFWKQLKISSSLSPATERLFPKHPSVTYNC